jgi:hypothetical protein
VPLYNSILKIRWEQKHHMCSETGIHSVISVPFLFFKGGI